MNITAKTFNYIFCGRIKHISRFMLVGISNTLVDFLAFIIFYQVLGMGTILSQILAYGVGILNSFNLNRRWTFGDTRSSKRTFHELIQFVAVNLISLTLTVVVMNWLVKDFSMNVYLSKILVIIVAQVSNFLFYRLWIFS